MFQIELAFRASEAPEVSSTARNKAIFLLAEIASLRGDAVEERKLVGNIIARVVRQLEAIFKDLEVAQICQVLSTDNEGNIDAFDDDEEFEEGSSTLETYRSDNSTLIPEYKMLLGKLMDSKSSKNATLLAFRYVQGEEDEQWEKETDKMKSLLLRILIIESFCYGKSSAVGLREANLV